MFKQFTFSNDAQPVQFFALCLPCDNLVISSAHFSPIYLFIYKVQSRIIDHKHGIKGVGGLKHDEYRASKNLHSSVNVVGDFSGVSCIDGDLVERLLELPQSTIAEVRE